MTLDLDRATLTDAVAALRRGEVGSEELLDAQLDRIDIFNPSVNAVVAFDVDGARAAARAADAARASGEELGPLGGIPLTIKDTYETEGLVTTAGAPVWADHVPTNDADVVRGLRESDGILYGKTNVPLFAGDHQSYNDVYGLTRNAWDPDRTAGGSSGGAAVAVSCGFSLGEVGSDIGGSIRVPAHFNGVFGLKPSWGAISYRGHMPPAPGDQATTDLSVSGPLGRSIADLELMLDACLRINPLGGAPGAALPEASPVDVASLRVGVWADDPVSPVSAATRNAVTGVAERLDGVGATIDPGIRPATSSGDLHDIYSRLLFAVMGADLPERVRASMVEHRSTLTTALDAGDSATFNDRMMRDNVADHRDWLIAHERRCKVELEWATLFDSVDVMIMPVCQTPAFAHDTERPYVDRTVDVDGVERNYHELLFWAGLATMPQLPSVVIPTGTVDGLPLGIQIVGPRWSDRQLLATADAMCEALDLRFVPPTLVTG